MVSEPNKPAEGGLPAPVNSLEKLRIGLNVLADEAEHKLGPKLSEGERMEIVTAVLTLRALAKIAGTKDMEGMERLAGRMSRAFQSAGGENFRTYLAREDRGGVERPLAYLRELNRIVTRQGNEPLRAAFDEAFSELNIDEKFKEGVKKALDNNLTQPIRSKPPVLSRRRALEAMASLAITGAAGSSVASGLVNGYAVVDSPETKQARQVVESLKPNQTEAEQLLQRMNIDSSMPPAKRKAAVRALMDQTIGKKSALTPDAKEALEQALNNMEAYDKAVAAVGDKDKWMRIAANLSYLAAGLDAIALTMVGYDLQQQYGKTSRTFKQLDRARDELANIMLQTGREALLHLGEERQQPRAL